MRKSQVEQLYRGIIGIRDEYIDEARNERINKKTPAWIRWSSIAACVCLVAAFALAAFLQQGQRTRQTETMKNYVVSISKDGNQKQDTYKLSYTEITEGMSIPVVLSGGTTVQAAYVTSETDDAPKEDAMTRDEAEYYAYMDYDTASMELKEVILEAREQIIYSQSWVADGYECYIIAPDGTKEQVPTFSELFPGWDIPAVCSEEAAFTADGLGRDAQFGIFAVVMEIEQDYMICQVTSSFAPFEKGQSVRVYFPENYDVGGVEEGKRIMVAFYGKDCSSKDSLIYAKEISDQT